MNPKPHWLNMVVYQMIMASSLIFVYPEIRVRHIIGIGLFMWAWKQTKRWIDSRVKAEESAGQAIEGK